MSYSLREAISGFRRAPLLTGLSAGMVALALFVIGLFSLVAHNLRIALEEVESRVEVVVYLRDGADLNEVGEAEDDLRRMPEVRSVRYVSKEQAVEKLREDLPEFGEIFSEVETNPLPASLELQVESGSRDPESLARISDVAAVYPFVEDVRYGTDWVDRLYLLRRIGLLSSVGLGAAFAVVGALIIGSAIRIALYARREEIFVMRLVGARDSFVRRPFLIEGAITGLLGGILATFLTYWAYMMVHAFVFPVSFVPLTWVGTSSSRAWASAAPWGSGGARGSERRRPATSGGRSSRASDASKRSATNGRGSRRKW
jgi:cell division transport system permease protein